MEILGLPKLQDQFRDRVKGAKPASAIIGYTAAYSVFVHENLEAHHPVGQAKFLEQPARQGSNDGTLQGIINGALWAGLSMSQALLRAALWLQGASQKLCPVLTGNLRNSAFTRLEEKT